MRKLIFSCVLALCLVIPNIVTAQWTQDTTLNHAFVTDELNLRSNHGLTVDPDGNVWIQQYYADTIFPDGSKGRAIYVYDSNSVQTAISPITEFVWADGSRTDPFGTTGLGVSSDYDGNIIVAVFGEIYKLDYKTGKVLAHAVVSDFINFGETSKSITRATADEEGNVYVRAVFPNFPLVKYDRDLKNPEIVVPVAGGFSRTIQVSADGMTLWTAGYDMGSVQRFTKPDEFSSFGAADTVLKGLAVEAFTIQQATGRLWVGAGSTTNMPDMERGYFPERFYAFDMNALGTENEKILDSLVYNNGTTDLYTTCRPRAIDFTADGKTAFIGMFDCSTPTNAIQKFTSSTDGVSNENNNLSTPTRIALDQNYPNPFNPTTNISFTLNEQGMVSIKVYDMTGREVATIANARYTAGTHQATFDASNLASGVYLYSLQANGVRLTNKMTLIK